MTKKKSNATKLSDQQLKEAITIKVIAQYEIVRRRVDSKMLFSATARVVALGEGFVELVKLIDDGQYMVLLLEYDHRLADFYSDVFLMSHDELDQFAYADREVDYDD